MSDHPAAAAFDRLTAWLKEHAPQVAADLNPPASAEALEGLSRTLQTPAVRGLTASTVVAHIGEPGPVPGEPDPDGPAFGPLPDDLRAVLSRHDGTEGAGFLPVSGETVGGAFYLLPAAEIAENYRCQRDLTAISEFAANVPEHTDPGVRATWWDVGWLPFAGDGGGDLLCLDHAPADGGPNPGTVGQVIAHSHETGEHRVLAPSLAAYLHAAADALVAGDLVWDADEEEFLPADG